MSALAAAARPACHRNPEAFFPVAKSAEQLAAAAHTARTYCQPCPYRDACRARGRREPVGIWGGLLRIDDGRNTTVDLLRPIPTSPRKAKQS